MSSQAQLKLQPGKPDQRMWLARSALLSTVTAVIAVALSGCTLNAEPDQAAVSEPQPVQVMAATPGPDIQDWSYVGTIRPRYASDLGFRISGKIVQRSVELGQRVETGQVLATLDTADLELAVAAKEAELEAARASAQEADTNRARYEDLAKKGFAAKAAYDQRLSAAAEASARVERDERDLQQARNELTYATLRADQPGVVTALPVEAGQVVAAGQLVARVARLDAIEVEVAIPEQKLGAVKSARAEVELWAGSGRRLPATLREVSPDADPASRTYRARFALTGASSAVELGRTATVHLASAASEPVIELPLSAVMSDGTATLVWVVSPDGKRAIRTPVEIKALAQDRAVIRAGLAAGDRVITLGVHMLDPDKPIRVIEQRSPIAQNS